MGVAEKHPKEDLIRYLDGELAGEEKRRLEAHLEACADCRESLSFARDFNEDLAEQSAGFGAQDRCPDSWTLASFEAGKSDEGTARHVRAHLLFCEDCSEKYYALRRLRGPGWTRVILRAVEGFLECATITGAGKILQPVPAAALLRGTSVPRTGSVQVTAAVPDPETGITATVSLRVDADPYKPEAAIVLEARPLPPGWKASLLDAQEQEVASVPLGDDETTIASGLSYGSYTVNLHKGETNLASFELDIRTG